MVVERLDQTTQVVGGTKQNTKLSLFDMYSMVFTIADRWQTEEEEEEGRRTGGGGCRQHRTASGLFLAARPHFCNKLQLSHTHTQLDISRYIGKWNGGLLLPTILRFNRRC